ncbi:hypothetical protein [Lentibacter sp.]|uniref:hypothetical protein n=1 Tax=Lentibacter sp. TaxID=2024994 RepID=UPI003F6A04AF
MIKWVYGAIGALAFAGLLTFLGSGAFTRFEHKTFLCSNTLIGPFELIINKAKVGADIQLSQPIGDSRLPITSVTGNVIIAEADTLRFEVDIEHSLVRVQQMANLSASKCETTNFSM